MLPFIKCNKMNIAIWRRAICFRSNMLVESIAPWQGFCFVKIVVAMNQAMVVVGQEGFVVVENEAVVVVENEAFVVVENEAVVVVENEALVVVEKEAIVVVAHHCKKTAPCVPHVKRNRMFSPFSNVSGIFRRFRTFSDVFGCF